ncbi:hypothetical protein INR49_011937 [Caranx melampygus]|nr:hypothetical protein INR49_011937 [Caranx melampygus]
MKSVVTSAWGETRQTAAVSSSVQQMSDFHSFTRTSPGPGLDLDQDLDQTWTRPGPGPDQDQVFSVTENLSSIHLCGSALRMRTPPPLRKFGSTLCLT